MTAREHLIADREMRQPTRAQRIALTTRADLLAEEAELVAERGITWAGRLKQLGGYGRSGGSAMDRRLIVEAMAALEAQQ